MNTEVEARAHNAPGFCLLATAVAGSNANGLHSNLHSYCIHDKLMSLMRSSSVPCNAPPPVSIFPADCTHSAHGRPTTPPASPAPFPSNSGPFRRVRPARSELPSFRGIFKREFLKIQERVTTRGVIRTLASKTNPGATAELSRVKSARLVCT